MVAAMRMQKIKCYSELSDIQNFIDRFKYLKLGGNIGIETFGFDRYLNQEFYRNPIWKKVRREVILRDLGCDLGCSDRPIPRGVKVFVHHMNPIGIDDIVHHNQDILDPEYLILTTFETHNAIHYGDESLLAKEPVIRTQNDTCPWR